MALWYNAGTLSLTQGSQVAVGIGTSFLSKVKVGDMLIAPGPSLYEVESITNDTQLRLTAAYIGDTVASVPYSIVPTVVQLKLLASQVASLVALYSTIPDVATDAQAALQGAQVARDEALIAETGAETARDQAVTLKDQTGASATSAATDAATATTKAAEAAASAGAALASEDAAAASETAAAGGAGTATTKAAEASASATAAATSETNALASKNAAATSATNAATSEGNALTSKNAAATSATNAATSESNALASKNAAATSETNAATSASTATTKAGEAATSASDAATSASGAADSADAAAASAASIAGGPVASVNGLTDIVVLTKADVGLGNVDNTSDANKPVSSATQTALNGKANLASPGFTGNPTAPTQASTDNSTRIATTAWAKLGFVFAAGGSAWYIKFPAWLGGLMIQMGSYDFGSLAASASSPTYSYTLPAAFPNQHFATVTTSSDRAMATGGGTSGLTQWYASFQNNWNGGALNMSGRFISIGN
jgi:hypothetical protein